MRNDNVPAHNRQHFVDRGIFATNLMGSSVKVVALSVTEGEDKPLKYPTMFAKADLVLLTKVDLLPHIAVSMDALLDPLARSMPNPNGIALSAREGFGVDDWQAWLQRSRANAFQAAWRE